MKDLFQPLNRCIELFFSLMTSAQLIDDSKVLLKHSSGSSAEIYLHGATVTSWKTSDGTEQLFLSSKALLDGSKAIRGGIPIVFPQFGLGSALPKQQHGFARVTRWKWLENFNNSEDPKWAVTAFELVATEKIKQSWPYDFKLTYVVKLNDYQIETKLQVQNTSAVSFNFTCLLHTYFKVGDITKTSVRGLKQVKYEDKVGKNGIEVKTEANDEISFSGEVDRVYFGIPKADYVIRDSARNNKLQLKSTFRDVVVWNPWIEKAKSMADLDDDGYKNFVCVEVGNVHEAVELKANSKWEATQTISAAKL